MSMTNFIAMDIALFLSYYIFFFIYQKVGMTKWIKKNWTRALIAFTITFSICIIGILIMSRFILDKQYQIILSGAFLGISAGIIPHIYLSFKSKS